MLRYILILMIFLTSVQAGISQTLAFPTAVGFGKNVIGGRNGTVYHVTNLNDAGPGSFRDAVSASNRIIVFDVSGYITLKSAVSASSNLTIAGQTAPGEGIGFRGGKISFGKQSNIIIRNIRVRPGDEVASNEDVGINLYNAKNIIVDHCSIEFAPWNNIGGVSDNWQTYPVTNVTFQNCLIADPTYQQFGAHIESVNSDWTWAYNIFANSHNRNPLDKVNDVFVNNVLYNCSAGYTTHTSTNFKHDIINNYFVMGPASTGTDNQWYQVDKNQSIYYAGNLKDKNLDGLLNGTATSPSWYQGTGTVLSAPWSAETAKIPTYSAATAFRYTSSFAGTFPYDEMDRLVMSQVRTVAGGTTGYTAGTRGPGGSLYTTQTQTGLGNNGYGTIATGTRPTDTDNDGMPDFWEKANNLNINSNDAMAVVSGGYANIEKYINWLTEPHTQANQNSFVNVDLSTYSGGFAKVSPSYTISNAVNGTAALNGDGKTARFTPATNFYGVGSFKFTVAGSDGTSYTFTVSVVVVPSAILVKPIKYIYNYDNSGDFAWTNANSWTPKAVPTALDTVIIRAGEVQITDLNHTAPLMIEPNGILRLVNANSTVNDLRLQGGTLKLFTSSPEFTLTSNIKVESPSTVMAGSVTSTVFTLNGTISGSSDLTKTSVGNLRINSTAAGYKGNWIITEGKLQLRSPSGLGICGVQVKGGARLDIEVAGASIYYLKVDSTGGVDLDQNLTTGVVVLGNDNVLPGSYSTMNRPGYIGSTGSLVVNNAILTAGSTTICTGTSVLLTTLSSSTYSWKNGVNQVGTAQAYSAVAAGVYTITVANASGCKASSAAITVTQVVTPTAIITTATPTTFCSGGSVVLTSSAGASYRWLNGSTQVSTTQNYTATTSGNYTVEVTNANGCKAISTLTAVTVNALPTATINQTPMTGSVLLTVNAGASYKWFKDAAQVGTTQSYTATTSGNYAVEVTNANGCKTTSAAVSVTVTIPNQPPTIIITSPVINATFTAPASITINANAADVNGTVTNVQFFNGATLLATDVSSPYSFSWTNVAAGNYSITAKATDNAGATTTSSVITIVVNNPVNTSPAVSLTAPLNNATFTSPASISITATATDANGSVSNVQFFNGSTLLGSDATAPYTISWTNVVAGTYSITAKATDNAGAITTSSVIIITVNNPTATLAKHGAGPSSQSLVLGTAIIAFNYTWTNASTVSVTGLPVGVTAVINNTTKNVVISGVPSQTGTFAFKVVTVGGTPNATKGGTIIVSSPSVAKITSFDSEEKATTLTIVIPNPSSDVFNMKVEERVESFSILNNQGLIVYNGGAIEKGESFQLGGHLKNGFYILVLRYASGRAESIKMQKIQ